jgi:glutathione S-transferase
MTYQLHLGSRHYFSWSLAIWLMVERFGLQTRVRTTIHRPDTEDGVARLIAHLAPARTLPTLVTPDGAILSDSLAIAEELATRHPGAGLWPDDPLARGTARTLAAEMHSSFRALRGVWPMNLRQAFQPQKPPPEVATELDRLEVIWTHARRVTGSGGPWLTGGYSIADAIFAPMAGRLAGYGFDTRPTTRAYVAAHLADPAFRRWRAMGFAGDPPMPSVSLPLLPRPWPGPAPLPARAVDGTAAINAACPYSGDPVTHVLELDGRRWGFCNAFCRDKTVADAAAWPAFTAMLAQHGISA